MIKLNIYLVFAYILFAFIGLAVAFRWTFNLISFSWDGYRESKRKQKLRKAELEESHKISDILELLKESQRNEHIRCAVSVIEHFKEREIRNAQLRAQIKTEK